MQVLTIIGIRLHQEYTNEEEHVAPQSVKANPKPLLKDRTVCTQCAVWFVVYKSFTNILLRAYRSYTPFLSYALMAYIGVRSIGACSPSPNNLADIYWKPLKPAKFKENALKPSLCTLSHLDSLDDAPRSGFIIVNLYRNRLFVTIRLCYCLNLWGCISILRIDITMCDRCKVFGESY